MRTVSEKVWLALLAAGLLLLGGVTIGSVDDARDALALAEQANARVAQLEIDRDRMDKEILLVSYLGMANSAKIAGNHRETCQHLAAAIRIGKEISLSGYEGLDPENIEGCEEGSLGEVVEDFSAIAKFAIKHIRLRLLQQRK